MGAPGVAMFCTNGHLYHWINDDMYWDEILYSQEKKAKADGCPCGENFLLRVYHYGNINDCVCLDNEIPTKGIIMEGEDEVRVKRTGFTDKNNNPIDAYEIVKMTRYFIPQGVRDRTYI